MKKQSSKIPASLNSVVRYILLLILTVGLTPLLHAEKGTDPSPAAEIKYLGTVNDQLYFQVNFENKNDENYSVIVKDEDGNVLYSERFNDKQFSKKFQYDRFANGDAKLTFIVETERGKQLQEFNINTRVIENIEVTKL